MFNEAKYQLILKSLKTLSRRFDQIYQNYLKKIIDFPILISYCHPQTNNISYLPNPEDVRKSIFDQFISEKIYSIIYRRNFLEPQEFPNYMTVFEEVFEANIDQNTNLNFRIQFDPIINGLLKNIRNVVNNSFASLDSFSKSIVPIKKNHNKYSSINFENLTEKTTPEELKDLFEKFLAEEKEVLLLRPKVFIGIFEYNLDNL